MSKIRTRSFAIERQSPLDKLIKKIRFHKIENLIPKGSVLIDLGCGYNGELPALLSNKISRAIGVDLEITPSNSLPKNISLIRADLNKVLPIKSSSADIITALAIIEHLENYHLFLKEIYRILKPGGTLLLTTPHKRAKWLLEFLEFKLKLLRSDEILDHKQYFNQDWLIDELKSAGFKEGKIKIESFEMGFNILAKVNK